MIYDFQYCPRNFGFWRSDNYFLNGHHSDPADYVNADIALSAMGGFWILFCTLACKAIKVGKWWYFQNRVFEKDM